jgi:hypothetical protein
MWQSLSFGANYKAAYCLAVCPAGEDVLAPFLDDRPAFLAEIVKPLQQKPETIFVVPGSDADEYVSRAFPGKTKRHVNGLRPTTIAVFSGHHARRLPDRSVQGHRCRLSHDLHRTGTSGSNRDDPASDFECATGSDRQARLHGHSGLPSMARFSPQRKEHRLGAPDRPDTGPWRSQPTSSLWPLFSRLNRFPAGHMRRWRRNQSRPPAAKVPRFVDLAA